MYHLFFLNFLICAFACINYSYPIIINTGLNNSYLITYDSDTQLIFIGYNKTITVYNLVGEKVQEFNVKNQISSFGVTNDYLLLMTTQPENNIYAYDVVSGTFINAIIISGKNKQSQIFVNRTTGEFYAVFNYGFIGFWNVYSFDKNHQMIANIYIDRDMTGWGNLAMGDLTGNFMYSTYNTIQSYDKFLNTTINLTLMNDDDLFPYTPLIENFNSLYYFRNLETDIYNPNGKLLFNITKKFRVESSIDIWYETGYLVTIFFENDIPYITFFTSTGEIKCKIKFGNDKLFSYYNTNVFMDQFTGTIIANINSQIKILVPN